MEEPRYKVGETVYVGEAYIVLPDYPNTPQHIIYRADNPDYKGKWKSGRYMPEKYARIKLKITGAERQPLIDIVASDIRAEGFKSWDEFKAYFKKINPEANRDTEVWAYTFERVK
jgi:hypothetical protein